MAVGWWGRMRGRAPQREAATPPRVFHSTPVADVIAQLASQTGPVTRDEALSVPAIVRARNEIAAISTLPLRCYDAANVVVDRPLLRQFDTDVPNVVHLSMTIEDLIFYGISWWRVTGYGWDGFPVSVRRVEPGAVSVNPPVGRSLSPLPSGVDPRGGIVYVDGLPVAGADMIRFDSPNPGLLTVGARVIRTAIALDRAARLFADQPPAREVLSPADGQDLEQTEIDATLADYQARSKAGVTRWLPSTVKREEAAGYSPGELQLVEMKRQNVLELANLTGLDPEELGLSTTSRTYKNINERRIDKVNETLAPYLSAITDRLNMRSNIFPATLTARWDLTDYLKADALDRSTVQSTYVAMGVLSPQEVRDMERIAGRAPGKPAQTAPEPPQDPDPADTPPESPEATVEAQQAARRPVLTFADKPAAQFVRLELQTFSVDAEARVIEGVAVPYGAVGNGARFERGALKWDAANTGRIKLNLDHDPTQTVGVMTHAKDGNAGLHVKFRVARTPEGDRALTLAEDGVYDGLSIEIPDDPKQVMAVPDPRRRAGLLIKDAPLIGVALTPSPAFDDARLTRVKFTQEEPVGDTDTTPQAVPEATPAQVPALTLSTTQQTAANTSPVAAQFTAEEVERLRSFARVGEDRAVVNPTTRPVATVGVRDPASYRFARDGSLQTAAHDFGIDLVRAVHPDFKDEPAKRRVLEFMTAHFNVATGDVNELNPTINLPRYIDQREFTYPIYSAVNRGAPPNGVQPFSWPAFSSAAGLVGAHVEGTEPTTGSYVTTSQSVTPVPLSGKATVNREVWDMGGVPGLSDILWRRIIRDWYEGIEARIVTMLDAATPTSLGALTVGGGTGHVTLVQELRRYLALLQFARGGFRFDVAFCEAGIYTHLVDSFDTTGRPFFPVVSPSNADGDSAAQWGRVNIGGTPFLPAWALGATVGTVPDSSYLIDRTAVDSWSTPPQRLTFDQIAVATVQIGVWGYVAEAINDLAGVREISYDPVAP